MIASKVTSKYQATIPRNIRRFLDLKKGDRVKFEVKDNQVVINRIQISNEEYLKAVSNVMVEWNSTEDEEAYENL